MRVEPSSHYTDRIDLFSKSPVPENLPKTDKDSLASKQAKSTFEEWKDAIVDFFYKIWNYVKPYLCFEWMQPDTKAINLKKELETFFNKYFTPDPKSDAPSDQKQIAEAFENLSSEAKSKIKEYLRKHLRANYQDSSDEAVNLKIQNNLADEYFGNAVCTCVSDLRSKVGV